MRAAGSDKARAPERQLLVWAALVSTLSGLGLIPFYAFVPDLSKFTGNLPLLGIGVDWPLSAHRWQQFWSPGACPAPAAHGRCFANLRTGARTRFGI